MTTRAIKWMADCLDTLSSFPTDVKRQMGFALRFIQEGKSPQIAKPWKGLGTGVYELVVDDGDAYRVVYAVKLGEHIYVLDAFQKKSTKGIKTPKHIVERVRSRYQQARKDSEGGWA